MILCDECKGSGSIPSATPFGYPSECVRCRGVGRLSFRDLRYGDHVCLLFKDPAAQLCDALHFLVEGLHHGERLLYAWDEHTPDEIRIKLIEMGIDVTREMERGALEIVRARDVYVRGGEFEPRKVLDFYKGYLDATMRAGFTGLRAAGEMSWVFGSSEWLAKVGEYEALCDEYIKRAKPRAIGLCQYNRARFSPEIIQKILQTHGAAVLS